MKGMSLNLDFSKMHLDNYKYLFSGNEDSRKYFMWYKNSLILTLITVVLTLLVCYFIAYGLTMYKFKLQGFLFFLVIATMCVPFEILMLPLYNEVTSLGIINTRAGVILPGLCGASTIFFFKQYMQSLPKELLDAGRIDGCTEYGISVKIMMPITKPAFASMAILCAMGSWNNMLWPMLVFRDTSKFTLQIGLNTLLTPYGNNYNLLIAGSMFGILPILIILEKSIFRDIPFITTSRPSWKEAKKPARSGNAISTQRIAKSPVDNTDATLLFDSIVFG